MKNLTFVFPRTFHYVSHFWTNKNEYNLRGGKTGFDTQETKLPSFWETNFSKICLGMRSAIRQTLCLSTYKPALYIPSLLMGFIDPPLWVVFTGKQ